MRDSQVVVVVKNPPANARDVGLIPGLEDPLEKEMATHSSILALENSMDRGARQATVHEVAKESDMTYQPNNNNN